MTSTVAGSNNQLSGFHGLSLFLICCSLICLSPILSLLFCFLSCRGEIMVVVVVGGGLELFWTAELWATWSQSAQQSEGDSQEAAWPGGFGLYARHRLLKGWRASLLHWGRASAMFTVMFQGMLRGFKHIKHIYRNTDIGNAVGSRTKGTPENTHTYTLPKTLP